MSSRRSPSQLLSPRPRERRSKRGLAGLIDVELDPAQQRAVTLPAERAVLVLGEAGHGKTTVALHRLAHVLRARARSEPSRAAVVVPSEGLARLIQPLLRRLGIDVEASTYDRWASAEARRAFPRLPRRESELTPAAVARVKRDPALVVGVTAIAGRARAAIDDDADRAARLEPMRASRSEASRSPRARRAALAGRGDLQHLFGDRLLLEAVARESSAITARAIDETLEHTRVQFSLRAEREWAHVTDRARLVAVDGRDLDEGTAAADAGTVDVEDYAVLFAIDRLRALARGAVAVSPRLVDVLLIDEAQELAPLELALLGRSLAPGGTLIVAGDADQQVDPTTAFGGWEGAMRHLGQNDYETAQLDVGYRCPPDVVALARSLRGVAPEEGAARAADGSSVVVAAFANEAELGQRVGGALGAIRRSDPRASILVVCRSPLTARRLVERLRVETPARLVFDGRFLARGPVEVTTVEEARGLEFDFVVVPDATAVDYPDAPAARRALYVAVTRARHQLLLAHTGERTPLVRG